MEFGLTRSPLNENIFYDSIKQVWRYRMHCPNCTKVSVSCRCYGKEELDKLLCDIDSGIADLPCNAKCCLELGEFDTLDDVMRGLGLGKDIRDTLNELSETESMEVWNEYDYKSVLLNLYKSDSDIPISHLKDPTHDERLEIIFAMGDGRGTLDEYDKVYLPELKDLSDDDAQRVIDKLTEEDCFDRPSGEACVTG